MPSFEVSINKPLQVNGSYVDKGLSVQVSTMCANPMDESEKVNSAFQRIHGIDLRSAGYLTLGVLDYRKL